MTPNALDLTVAAIILLSTLVAYFRGIVREFFMLAGLALATFISYKFGHLLAPDIAKWLGAVPNATDEKPTILGLLKPAMATNVGAYGGVFLLVFGIMVLIRMMISHWINGAGLSIADRILGAGFGFLRGFLLVFLVFATCLYIFCSGSNEKLPAWAKDSVSVPVLESTLAWTKTHVDLDKIIDTSNGKVVIRFDQVKTDVDEAAHDLKAEVGKGESQVQRAPETPPAPAAAPVTPVAAAPVSPSPSTPPSGPPEAVAGKTPSMPAPAAPTGAPTAP